MKNALRKEFHREIRGSLQRFVSILLLSALGAAMFAGLRACKTDMLLSADSFYDKTNMMDVRAVSVYGMGSADEKAVREVEGVLVAEGVFSADMLVRHGDADVAVRLYSDTEAVNTYMVLEGRMPEERTECAMDQRFMELYGFSIGDTVTFHTGTSAELSETLHVDTVTVVGAVTTGRYMSSARGSGTIGNGKIAGYLVLPPESFAMDYYSELCIVFQGTGELQSYSAEYDTLVEERKDAIKEVAGLRAKARFDEVQGKAYEELDDAKKKVQENEQALFDGEKELIDAEKEIADGYLKLEEGKKEFQEQKEALPGSFFAYEEQIEQAKQMLSEAFAQFEKEEAAVVAARAEYDAYVEQLKEISQGPEDIKQILEVMGISEEQILESEEQVAAAKKELNDREAELRKQEEELTIRKEEAFSALDTAKEELDASERKLKESEQELTKAKEDYYATLEENRAKIADAYEEIEENRAKVDAMELTEWYLLDRNTIESYVGFEQDADRMNAVSKVFPVIFFLVSALVSLTTMTRMVDEGRTQIGTLKALGYSRRTVAEKYIKYALYATLLGSLAGVFLGGKIFPYIVITTYKLMYPCLPEVVMPIHVYYSVMAILIAVFCTLAATLAACMRSFKEQPAALMRPVAPKEGRRILLERIGFIWKHLSFTRKASLRNMFRYKKRFFMTVIGIGGCMALLLVGFGLKDSIGVMAHIQYGELWLYDGCVTISASAGEEEREELFAKLKQDGTIADASRVYETTMDIVGKDVGKSISLVVLPDADAFDRFFCFRDRNSGEVWKINDEEIILTEKLAKLLHVKSGDTVQLKPDEASFYPVKIGAVAENYIFHYVFMTQAAYEKIFGGMPEYNECFLVFQEKGTAAEEAVAANILKQNNIVTSVTVTSTLQKQIDDMLKSLNIIVYVLIICAGMLAFIVLYNLSNINITERRRELATLKVLGFYDGEVSGYVYRENVLMTLIGILLGMAGGKLLHGYVITTCEVDMVMFGHIIKPISFLYSGLLTVLFAVLVGMMMHFKLKKIDMVESLKSIE
ncbi:MAG: FtsX-like permease family protein [Lachnospiraceae bacterium]|nr:FtsX-like permease family protein [Lachnospiraceae bacterium]